MTYDAFFIFWVIIMTPQKQSCISANVFINTINTCALASTIWMLILISLKVQGENSEKSCKAECQ